MSALLRRNGSAFDNIPRNLCGHGIARQKCHNERIYADRQATQVTCPFDEIRKDIKRQHHRDYGIQPQGYGSLGACLRGLRKYNHGGSEHCGDEDNYMIFSALSPVHKVILFAGRQKNTPAY